MGKIFYIMGKSSSGKDTIYKKLSERMPELQRIVPYTTRPIRDGEQEGVEYHFVGEDRLREMQEAGRVIEVRAYNTKCGVWTYFTADDGQIDLEKKDYLVIGTLESFQALKKYFGEEKIVPIYIEVDDGVRLSRALEREQREKEPRYEEMCRRFLSDSADFSEGNLRRSGIRKRFVNMELERCLEEIGAYIKDFRV